MNLAVVSPKCLSPRGGNVEKNVVPRQPAAKIYAQLGVKGAPGKLIYKTAPWGG